MIRGTGCAVFSRGLSQYPTPQRERVRSQETDVVRAPGFSTLHKGQAVEGKSRTCACHQRREVTIPGMTSVPATRRRTQW